MMKDESILSEVESLRGAMESIRGNGTEWKTVEHLDQFAVDNFYLLTLNKTKIDLDLLFHSVSQRNDGDVPDDTTNVMRGDFIALFPNLSIVKIWYYGDKCGFCFSVCRLLDELSDVNLPRSLSTIVIGDKNNEFNFIRKQMDSEDLRKRADAMNITMKLKKAKKRNGFDQLSIRINH